MDPDPYLEYESGSRKLLNTDPMRIRIHNTDGQCCKAGAGTFWPEPVQRSGSGSTVDKTDEILFVSSHIDKRLVNGPAPQHFS